MKKVKEILSYVFIDGISGMALGLFATLIIGTILAQIASFGGGNLAIVYPDGEQLLIDPLADGEKKPDVEA